MSKVKAMLKARDDSTSKIDKKELIRQVRSQIEEAVEAIFEDNPTVNIIVVAGHVPHFNDGDVCRWGLDVQVDWYGECVYGGLYQEMEDTNMSAYSDGEIDEEALKKTKFAKFLSRKAVCYSEMDKTPGYKELKEATKLLYSFKKEFEIWDDDANGTAWTFIRNTSLAGFKTVIENFEHD